MLAITSPSRLHRDWRAALASGKRSLAERLLAQLRPGAALVTVADSHPATLSWLGGVAQNLVPLLLTAPEQGLNTGNQLFRRKWFDQIVIRARF